MPTPASGAVTVEGLETFWGPELMQIGMKAMVAIKALGGVAVRCSKTKSIMVEPQFILSCYPAAVPFVPGEGKYMDQNVQLIPLSDMPERVGDPLRKDHRKQPIDRHWEWWPVVGLKITHERFVEKGEPGDAGMCGWHMLERPLMAWPIEAAEFFVEGVDL